MEYIISNQVECIICGDRPFSGHRHDYKSCKCGNVSVDGGQSYLRRVGNSYEEQSITIDNLSLLIPLTKEVENAINTGRNPLGIVLAVFRGIRDVNLVVEDNHWKVDE